MCYEYLVPEVPWYEKEFLRRAVEDPNLMDGSPPSAEGALRFPGATTAELVRASQKDLFYWQELYTQSHHALQALLGTQRSQRWLAELRAATSLLYFGLTTGRGVATLGEEYCELRRVDASTTLPPHSARSWLSVILCAAIPYSYVQFKRYIANAMGRAEEGTLGALMLAQMHPWVESIRGTGEKLLLAALCFGGNYSRLSDRIANIRHVRTGPLAAVPARAAVELLPIANQLLRKILFQAGLS